MMRMIWIMVRNVDNVAGHMYCAKDNVNNVKDSGGNVKDNVSNAGDNVDPAVVDFVPWRNSSGFG